MSHECPPTQEEEDLRTESWGIGRSVRGVLEEVNIAPTLRSRELLQQKLREILALIPEWTPDDEESYRTDRERQQTDREIWRGKQNP